MPTPISQKVRRNFFFALLLLVTVAFFGLINSYLLALFWAAILAIIFRNTFRRIRIMFNGRSNAAAAVTMLLILFLVLIPFSLISVALANQIIGFVGEVNAGTVDVVAPINFIQEQIPSIEEWVTQIGLDPEQIKEKVNNFGLSAAEMVANRALGAGQNILSFAIEFSLMLYLLFFFLRDGIEIIRTIISVVPMGDKREWRLLRRFASVSRATLRGTLIVAICQGSLGGLAFWILGIEGALFWGVVMTILSLLPVGGSGLVWIPTAIILFVQGAYVKAVILVIIGALFIGLIDNLLRPLLVGRDTKMPDYLVLISTLGGIAWFGLSGFVLGPVIAALFITCWEMVGEDYGGTQA